MKLNVGERLEGAGPPNQPGGYVVTSLVRESPWYALYAGKKVFYNFDFSGKRVRETDDVEWLDVLIRTNRYPILDDPSYVQQRRALARAEVRAVLGNRHSNLWPEPIDLLEIENTRDPFTFTDQVARAGEPVVVYTRPHGRSMPEWQQQILPVSSILSVLAELLEFIDQSHREGLLLLGMGPSSLLIDASDRVHYVGTEMVLSQQSALLKESTPAAVWQRLFPADRFGHGYSAPECFDPAKRPDSRSDMYAWGTLAYSLITGTDLTKIAQGQGRPWVTFLDAHWSQLEKVLKQLPRHTLQTWAEQLAVDTEAMQDDWPHKILSAFRMLLHADPARRPRSAAELRSWLADPPPPPVAAFMALHTDADTAKLLLDCTNLEPELEVAIQCSRNGPPAQPTDGWTVSEGALRPVILVHQLPLTSDPLYYSAFTRRKKGGDWVYSPGVAAQLWQPNDESLRRWVEEQASLAMDDAQIPPRIGMVLGAIDVRLVADSLVASEIQRIRAWGLRRVEQVVKSQGFSSYLEGILWWFLGDPHVEMRLAAATSIWTFHPIKTDALILRLIEALETPPIDAPVALVQFLRQLDLPEDRIRGILERLESRRPSECPLCGQPFTIGERGPHLQQVHGYLSYQGDLLPAETVIKHLWERVFEHHDRPTHEELVAAYLNLPEIRKDADAAVERYVADLQRILLGATTDGGPLIPVALPYASILAYQTNLRQSASFLPIVRQLLRSPQKRMRDMGTQSALPSMLDQLRARPTMEELRQILSSLCPDVDQTDARIEICRQLAQNGADQTLVSTCIAQLHEERLVVCPECSANVQSRDLELHLRRAHQVFQFRGVRKSYTEIRDAILRAICTAPADVAAWRSLHALAEDKHPQEGDRYIIVWLYQYLKDMDAEQRGGAMAAAAETVVTAGAAERLLPLCVGPSKNASWELLGQRLALEICIRIPPSIPKPMIALVVPFLDQKELPRRARENAMLVLLRSVDRDDRLALELVRAYVGNSSKKRGIEKLERLQQRFGNAPSLDLVIDELDQEIRMSCPRCPSELRKKEMVGHLWDKHRLVLDGQRVREPWRVIEDWVVDYGLEKDPVVLQRCRELALRDDPQSGLARLQRLLYRRGLRDRELLNELRTQVRAKKASLCPHCCELVLIEATPTVKPLTVAPSRLEGHGYHLEVSERGLIPSLQIESPDSVLFQGREPGRGLTRLGGILFFTVPLTAITFGVLVWITGNEYPPLLIGSMALGVGMIAASFLYLIWPSPRSAKERLIKAAWRLLVPEMLRNDMGAREWSFLHGLVAITNEMRHPKLNQDLLLECCEEASNAARNDTLAHVCLSSLSRRCIADMRDSGEDPFDFVLTLATECFKGQLPLSFLSDLLENFHGKERSAWDRSDLNRLTILIANAAFHAEVDIEDWLNLGRAFPVLNSVLSLDQRSHWLQFHAIWSERSRKAWEKAGAAKTMVEMAKTTDDFEDLLSYYPDVLLYAAGPNVVIGTKGVWIEGVCVTSYSRDMDISVQRGSDGYELLVGSLTIRCPENPRPHLDDIKRWLRWYFLDFVPSVSMAPKPMVESRHRMWQLSKVACPECEKSLVPCLGDLGVALR